MYGAVTASGCNQHVWGPLAHPGSVGSSRRPLIHLRVSKGHVTNGLIVRSHCVICATVIQNCGFYLQWTTHYTPGVKN